MQKSQEGNSDKNPKDKKIEFRRATTDLKDTNQIGEAYREILMLYETGQTLDQARRGGLQLVKSLPHTDAYILYFNDQRAGSLVVRQAMKFTSGQIFAIAYYWHVVEAFRGNRLGSEIIKFAKEYARNKQAKFIELVVKKDYEKAKAIYTKKQFVNHGVKTQYVFDRILKYNTEITDETLFNQNLIDIEEMLLAFKPANPSLEEQFKGLRFAEIHQIHFDSREFVDTSRVCQKGDLIFVGEAQKADFNWQDFEPLINTEEAAGAGDSFAKAIQRFRGLHFDAGRILLILLGQQIVGVVSLFHETSLSRLGLLNAVLKDLRIKKSYFSENNGETLEALLKWVNYSLFCELLKNEGYGILKVNHHHGDNDVYKKVLEGQKFVLFDAEMRMEYRID